MQFKRPNNKIVIFKNHLFNRLYISKTCCANYNRVILILKYPIIFMRFSVLANFSIFLASSSFTSSLNYICNMIYISKDMNLIKQYWKRFTFDWSEIYEWLCLTYHMLHVCHTRSEVGLACIYVFLYGFVLFSTRNSLMKGGISNEVSNSGVLGWRKEVIISEKPLTYGIFRL